MSQSKMFLTGDTEKDTKRITYLIFISAVSLISLPVAVAYYLVQDPEIKQVLYFLDSVYALFYLLDFWLRLRASSDRRGYFLGWGWLDLVTSLPGLPALRIVRSTRVIYHARAIISEAPDEIEQQARERLGESVLFVTVYVGLIVLSIGSMLIIYVEADAPGATIRTGGDALWWSLVTVSTVGYGDEFPVTPAGRVIGIFMIVVGVALFTTITSYLASTYTGRSARRERELQLQIVKENADRIEALMDRIILLEEKLLRTLQDDDHD